MKKTIFFFIALAVSFGFGFAFNNFISKPSNENAELKKVTGIGGIFFKCKDPKMVREWYQGADSGATEPVPIRHGNTSISCRKWHRTGFW